MVQFLLTFYSRKVFLNYLGEDVLGLNTTAVNILQFLNLAELGISTAVAFSLYTPLHDDDQTTINEIVSLQGLLYKRIAFIIITGAVIVMGFFPIIFKKITLPLWYAYASFGVLLFSALLGYFFNYRQIILTASQKDFKIQQSVGVCNVVKAIAQIIAVSTLSHPYLWWLVLEVVFSVVSTVALQIMVRRAFPYLKKSRLSYKSLKNKYDILITKTKQVFLHNIGGFALSQSSPLIIYAYANLALVAISGNYLLISTGVMRLFNAIFNSMGAGIGDLIAENNQERIMKVFYELFSLRFLLVSAVIFTLVTMGQPFIEIWLGETYLLPLSTLLIISATLFIRLNRYTVNQFLAGRGQYQDVYSPLAEAALNIGLSILLGYFYGLNGILSGVLISLIVIVELWKPYFLFRYGLKESLRKYFVNYLTHIIPAVALGWPFFYLTSKLWLSVSHSWLNLILFSISCFTVYTATLGLSLWVISNSFRGLIARLKVFV